MPAHARKDIVREGEVATYHCWSRCVQKAFLCGYDPETGRDFHYRCGWIEDLLAYQAGVFALDVGSYNLLSNHAHTILRTRPDIAATWSHEELALRWKRAWPQWHDGQWIREPTDQEMEALLALPEKLEQIRRHLSSLSWFMARWKEPIARLCNAEMDRSGHFWEARFGSRELLDEAAVLTCSIYVDLNQIRAGMAESLEDSLHSAIRNRILAAKRREAQASLEAFEQQDPADLYSFSGAEAKALFEDCWLAPITVDGPLLTQDSLQQAPPDAGPSWHSKLASSEVDAAASGAESQEVEHDAQVSRSLESGDSIPVESPQNPVSSPRQLSRRRASDAAIIDVPWSEYLRVLEAVAALSGEGQRGSGMARGAGESLEDVLTRWGLNPSVWLTQLGQLDRQGTRALGAAHRVMQRAGEVAQRWFHGIGWCREVFVDSCSDEFT